MEDMIDGRTAVDLAMLTATIEDEDILKFYDEHSKFCTECVRHLGRKTQCEIGRTGGGAIMTDTHFTKSGNSPPVSILRPYQPCKP